MKCHWPEAQFVLIRSWASSKINRQEFCASNPFPLEPTPQDSLDGFLPFAASSADVLVKFPSKLAHSPHWNKELHLIIILPLSSDADLFFVGDIVVVWHSTSRESQDTRLCVSTITTSHRAFYQNRLETLSSVVVYVLVELFKRFSDFHFIKYFIFSSDCIQCALRASACTQCAQALIEISKHFWIWILHQSCVDAQCTVHSAHVYVFVCRRFIGMSASGNTEPQ